MKNYLCKKLLLLVLAAVSFSDVLAQPAYHLKLDLTGFKDSTKFYLVNLDLGKAIDSAYIQQGKLAFKGRIYSSAAYRIHTIDGKYLVIYPENKEIRIKGNYTDFQYSKIEGSELNRYWTKSRDEQKTWQLERDSLFARFFSLSSSDSVRGKEILLKVETIDRAVLQYRLAFIRNEKPTYFTMNELFFLRNDLSADSLKLLFDKFPPALKNTKDGSVIAQYVHNKMPVVGNHFIDIEGKNARGESHKLSELAGKYVLLDFWASWCVPCRQETPATLKAYDQYRSKGFEIFGFSTDANKDDWLKAITADKLNWINVSDLQGSYSKGAASYQVRAIPQNFLIDPNGIIIAKDLRGDALAARLKEIYKN